MKRKEPYDFQYPQEHVVEIVITQHVQAFTETQAIEIALSKVNIDDMYAVVDGYPYALDGRFSMNKMFQGKL